ncbi:H-2 class I histocompatibility antigen, K-Q alpha chain-like [Stigmatopora nigra]
MLKMAALFVVAVHIQSVQPVIHTLQHNKWVSSQIPNSPEYSGVIYVDGVQITHYNSKSRTFRPKHDWVNKITDQEPNYWSSKTYICIDNQEAAKVDFKIANENFNQGGRVHTFQIMSGCQWNNETDKVDGWQRYAYDGKDISSLDLSEGRRLTLKKEAPISKESWEQSYVQNEKIYYMEICPYYLKMHVNNGKEFLMRTVLPRLSLLQKTPRSPVSCHATGFYPKDAVLFWTKDGKQISEGVVRKKTLPNHDGTYQAIAHLRARDPSALYECVFRLAGVPDNISVPLDDSVLLSNERIEAEERRKMVLKIVCPLPFPVVIVVAIAAFFGYKCGKARYAPARLHAQENEPASHVSTPKAM